uniref:Anoctamin n=1 Tax=Amphiprion percula TaxID=161767 RepID=A0A3P8U002_AMPPE
MVDCCTDFVLVWEEPLDLGEEPLSSGEGSGDTDSAHQQWREEFLSRLTERGLIQEQRVVLLEKKKTSFVLLSAPWSLLCYYAEEISLRVPLQVKLLTWLGRPQPPADYYTCQFRTNKLQRFLGSDHQETFFKTTQRHQVLYEILARTPYGSVKKGEVGIDRLVSEQVFTAAYPLHQVRAGPPEAPQLRFSGQILYAYWAQWSCWRRYQPLDHIREYFGEKIALYFAWIGFYTAWLLPASLVGTVIFLIGFGLMATDVPESLPLLHRSIINMSLINNTVFLSLWAVTFLQYWKRRCSVLAHCWDCSDFEDTEERPRPEFTAMAPMTVRNPVTRAEEPYFPEQKRLNRTLTSCMVIIIMVVEGLCVCLYNMCVVCVVLLYSVYVLCVFPEMHRTQTKYEDMFILKVFIFQFVNFYSSPVYIAFFKGRFVGYPGNYNTMFGVRNEDCGAGGCLIDLAQELLVIMVGKQLINNIQEFFLLKVKSWWQKRKLNHQEKEEDEEEVHNYQEEVPQWEADYQLQVCGGLFDEYLETVLQFGFITIFVAACPLAPLFALINNWVEIRLDAHKFVTEYRRPVAERAQDIGIWFPILQFITHMAVLSNAFLIAFTSSFLPRLYYRYTRDSTLRGFISFTLATSPHTFSQQHHNASCRYRGFRDENGEYLPEYFHLLAIRLGFIIVFEHVVFFIGRLIDLMVPDIPEEVELKIKREHYMAKEALAENQVQTFTSGLVSESSDSSVLSLKKNR